LRRRHCRPIHQRQYSKVVSQATTPSTTAHTTEPSKNGCHTVASWSVIHSNVSSSGRLRGGTCISQAPVM